MGATSTNGVGLGSVYGNQKGSDSMSLGVSKLIGPKVSAAGSATLSGTTKVVEIPKLVGVVEDYIVMVSAMTSTHVYVSTAMAAVANSDSWGFTITGGSGAVVNWTVIKK